MYRTRLCAYCLLAKRLVEKKGARVREIDLTLDPAARARLRAATNQRTVPQIYINGRWIGGYQELLLLERSGELDALLAAVPEVG
jgi:glutaredoxin 3